jgi:hypothetical protein
MSVPDSTLAYQIRALSTELIELACTLESRGRLDAADLAVTLSARLAELAAEHSANTLAQLSEITEAVR